MTELRRHRFHPSARAYLRDTVVYAVHHPGRYAAEKLRDLADRLDRPESDGRPPGWREARARHPSAHRPPPGGGEPPPGAAVIHLPTGRPDRLRHTGKP